MPLVFRSKCSEGVTYLTSSVDRIDNGEMTFVPHSKATTVGRDIVKPVLRCWIQSTAQGNQSTCPESRLSCSSLGLPPASVQFAPQALGRTRRIRADPPQLSPRPNWLEIWCQIGVKVRRFCRLSRLITSYTSITYFFRFSMAWKRSSVRSRSGPPTNPHK